MRLSPKYGFPEEISRIYIPQELYIKKMTEIERLYISHQNFTNANNSVLKLLMN